MEKMILNEQEALDVCARLGRDIDAQIDKDGTIIPIFLGVMNGALPFLYELVKHVKHLLQIDFIKVSSYSGTQTTGKLTIQKEPDRNLEGKDVYLIEDIIDTGITMHHLIQYIKDVYKPRHLYVVVLAKRVIKDALYDVQADFTGIYIDDPRYVLGFGFDYYGLGRSLPYVFIPSEEEKREWEAMLKADDPNFQP
ncbi:MAG: hypothetical protein HUJ60_00920 [Bacilli bacterium]|nr:hypothetical protein [Bacilli bacterium]